MTGAFTIFSKHDISKQYETPDDYVLIQIVIFCNREDDQKIKVIVLILTHDVI